MKSEKIHFCTYGSDRFEYSRWRLAKEAEESGWFDHIHIYGEHHIRHFNRPLKWPVAGYWWWKSEIQKMTFDKMNDGDIMVYLDAGCYINKYGKNIFDEYISLVKTNETGAYFIAGSNVPESYNTKRDTLILLGCDEPKYYNTNQIGSGFFMAVKNKKTEELVENFVKASRIIHLLNQDLSFNPEYSEFINNGFKHRHDQSVFSLLVKKTFEGKNLDINNVDFITVDDIKYFHYDEVNKVNEYFQGKITSLTDLKFPIIFARIDDIVMVQKISVSDMMHHEIAIR